MTEMKKMQGWVERRLTRGLVGYLRVADWAEQQRAPQRKGCVQANPGGSRPATGTDLEEGSTTVEYAIGAIATAGFAALLIAVLKSGGVKAMITSVIESALSI